MKQVTTGRTLIDIVSIGDLVAVIRESRSPGSMRRGWAGRDHHDVHVHVFVTLPNTDFTSVALNIPLLKSN